MSPENHYHHISISEDIAERSLGAPKIYVSTRGVPSRTKDPWELKGSFFLLSWFWIIMDLRCG